MSRLNLNISLFLTLSVALACPSSAQAQSSQSIRLVGIQQGCERDGKFDHALERRLGQKGLPMGLVLQKSGASLPACSGEGCARLIQAACPSEQSRLLGGVVVQGKETTKFRLWLHDIASGQTAYQDEYCQGCEVLGALTTQIGRLIAAPRFGASPSTVPSYCMQGGANASSPAQVTAGPLFLTVYGEGKNKAALFAALKQQLTLIGRKVFPVPIESKSYTSDVLKKIVNGSQNAQVLGVEVPKDGKLQLFLYDQKTELTDGKLLDCADCEKDKDALITRIQPEVSTMLDHCFGETCGGSGSPTAPPPGEACEPFASEAACTGPSALVTSGLSGSHIDPGTAKVIKGAVWGIAAASALAAGGLFIANAAGPGKYVDTSGLTIDNALWRPAWAVAGITIGLIGVAIPVTLIVNVAAKNSAAPKASSPTSAAYEIQCPG